MPMRRWTTGDSEYPAGPRGTSFSSVPQWLRPRLAPPDEAEDATPLVHVPRLRNTYLAALSAFQYIVVMGMVAAYSAPATADMTRSGSRLRGVTSDQITWIASMPMFSGVVGNLSSGYLSHKFGRKNVLMLISVSYVSSWLVIAYAPSVYVVYLGRLVSGFCAGISTVAVSAYVVEIAPTDMRGRLSSGFQVSYTLGVLVLMAAGIALRWSWLAIIGAVAATWAACVMVAMPESPPWLIRQSRYAEALRALRFLKGRDSNTRKELKDVAENLDQAPEGGVGLKELLNPTLYKPMAIAILLMFFQQASGISALMSYTVEIFESTGSSVDPGVASAVVAVVQVVATVIGSLLMDKSGRKKLFATSSACVALSLLVLGTYSYVARLDDIDLKRYGWIPLTSFVAYIFFYSIGLGPVPFVMTPEIVPIRYRSPVIATANVTCSFFSFLTAKVFEDMRSQMGLSGVYWTYAGFSFVSAIYGCFFLRETKGLTLHQIHRSFSNTPSEQ